MARKTSKKQPREKLAAKKSLQGPKLKKGKLSLKKVPIPEFGEWTLTVPNVGGGGTLTAGSLTVSADTGADLGGANDVTSIEADITSAGELHQALKAGFDPAAIVYDEPAKTLDILRFVLERGVNFNIDNFQEFDRVRELIGSTTPGSKVVGWGTSGVIRFHDSPFSRKWRKSVG